MGYTIVALKDKIMKMYPEIQKYKEDLPWHSHHPHH